MSASPGIVLLGDYPPPYGGVAVHVRSLEALLRSEGMPVEVIDIGKGGRSAPGVVHVRSGPRFVEELARRSVRGQRLHVHISGNNLKAWLVAGVAGAAWSLARRRPVLTVHSGLFPAHIARSVLARRLVRTVLPLYGRAIAVSRAVDEALQQMGAPGTQRSILPAYLESREPRALPPPSFVQARARWGPLLALAHHPSPIYGSELLLRAVAALTGSLPKLGVVVFGSGLEPAGWFVEALARWGVKDRVTLLGPLPHAETLAVMSGVDLFVRPTLADGDALSVREALALGVRCVASDAAVRPDGVVQFRAGEVGPLVQAIRHALARPAPDGSRFDVGPALLGLYEEMAKGEDRSCFWRGWGDATNARSRELGGERERAPWAGFGGLLQRLGWGSAVQDPHHEDPRAGQPHPVGQQHRQPSAETEHTRRAATVEEASSLHRRRDGSRSESIRPRAARHPPLRL